MRTIMDSSAATPSGMIGSGSGAPRDSASESEKETFTTLANFTFFHLHEKAREATQTAAQGARFVTLAVNLSDKVFNGYTLDDGLYGIKVNGDFGFGTRVPYWEIADVQNPFVALQYIGRLNGVYIADTTDLSRGRRAFINLYFSPYTRKPVHPLHLDVVPYNNGPLPADWQTIPAFISAGMYIQMLSFYRQQLEENELDEGDEEQIDAYFANLDEQEEQNFLAETAEEEVFGSFMEEQMALDEMARDLEEEDELLCAEE